MESLYTRNQIISSYDFLFIISDTAVVLGLMVSQGPILHIFNSTLVSGPETLVLPNLAGSTLDTRLVLLQETRNTKGARTVLEYAKDLGFQVDEIFVRGRFDLLSCVGLARLMRRIAPSVIHTHGPKAGLHALIAARLSRTPARLVTTHHGVRANDSSNKLKIFETVYEKLVIPSQDLCLTVCTSDADILASRGIDRTKIAIHLNGTDRPCLTGPQKATARAHARASWAQSLGLPSFDTAIPLWGVVGRLAPEKRHSLLLDAMALLIKKNPHTTHPQLLFFGSGPLEQSLRTQSQLLGLDHIVHFMGYRPGVSSEMAGLDLLLSLSQAEGLPINLIEAGWAGVPVAATAVDGVNDLIRPNESGFLIPACPTAKTLEGVLAQLMSNPTSASRWATALQSQVSQRFSRRSWLQELEKHYTKLSV